MEEIRNIIFFMQESTEEILALQPRIVWERNSKRAFRRKYVDELSDIIRKMALRLGASSSRLDLPEVLNETQSCELLRLRLNRLERQGKNWRMISRLKSSDLGWTIAMKRVSVEAKIAHRQAKNIIFYLYGRDGTVNGVRFDMEPRPVKWSKDVIDRFRRIKFNEEIWPRLEGLKPDEPDMFLGTEQGIVIQIQREEFEPLRCKLWRVTLSCWSRDSDQAVILWIHQLYKFQHILKFNQYDTF
ncbi:hypothetical protein BV898_15762 [Hypsibius exemplaris]|uniref:Uncharacterized protein n=1 Tax=Hypsibius exemplaris TaxID=2072580 RepID=A0A9X6NBR7_HYPEX|nr:hypothetical protein BV898_15762 [Hypsibius exemplaris]